MVVDPNIKKKADDIRNKIYGKEVRESLASGLEEMSSDVVETVGRQSAVESRQDSVESQWQSVIDETTGKDVISAPEIIAARDGEPDLKARLDKEKSETAAQLAHIAKSTVVNVIDYYNDLKVGNTVLTNGFYEENEFEPTVYHVLNVLGNENFEDIGNGIMVGDDCSIKKDNNTKLKPSADYALSMIKLGGQPNNSIIKSDVIATKILKNYTQLNFEVGKYFLHGSIIHGVNSKIKGKGESLTNLFLVDNTNQYPIKSPNVVLDSFEMLYDYVEVSGLSLDGNQPNNNIRTYGDIDKTFWGFGMFFSNVKNLVVKNVSIKDTEAYGVVYLLCDTVVGENLEFDMVALGGTNKDGMSGSAKNIYINNVKGYTADDMIAVSTGRSSLQGHNTGISIDIDIDNIQITNVEGKIKGVDKTWVGVGIYSHQAKINNVLVDNIKGDFTEHALRISDYWSTDTGQHSQIKKLNIGNLSLDTWLEWAIELKDLTIDFLKIADGSITKMGGGIKRFMSVDNCDIKNAFLTEIIVNDIDPSGSTTEIVAGNNSHFGNIVFDGVSGINSVSNTEKNFNLFRGFAKRIGVNNVGVVSVDGSSLRMLSSINNETSYVLSADKLPVSSDLIKSGVGTSNLDYIYSIVRGNKLIIKATLTVNIPSTVQTNVEILDLTDISFMLENTEGITTILGDSVLTLFENNTNKISLFRPLESGVASGNHTFNLNMEIPLI